MAFFDKLTQTASNVGKNVASSAAKVGSSAAVAAQEQTELAQLTMFSKPEICRE